MIANSSTAPATPSNSTPTLSDTLADNHAPEGEAEDYGGTDDDDEDDDNEDRFIELEEDLANVIADVHDLGHFSHLNYTGFIKIVKVCHSLLLLSSY